MKQNLLPIRIQTSYYLVALFLLVNLPVLKAQDLLHCELGELNSGGIGQDHYSATFLDNELYSGTLNIRKHTGNNNWLTGFGFGVSIDAMAGFGEHLYVGNQFGVFQVEENLNSVTSISEQLEWITCLYVHNGLLFMGGFFQNPGLSGMAAYDGQNLGQVGEGLNTVPVGFSLDVNGMVTHNEDMIVTGRFKFAGTTEVNSLARWDGEAWHPFGSGLYWEDHPEGYGYGNAVVSWKSNLVVGGFFDSVDGNDLPNLALWDGQSWQSVGTTPIGNIQDMAVADSVLYVSGYEIITMDGIAYDLAAWDGSLWHGLLRVDGLIYGLEISPDNEQLMVFGSFLNVNDGDPNSFVNTGAICNLLECNTVKVFEQSETLFSVYPNPVSDQLNISGIGEISTGMWIVTIYNMGNQNIKQISLISDGNPSSAIDFSDLPSGIYYVKISDGLQVSWHKVVKPKM